MLCRTAAELCSEPSCKPCEAEHLRIARHAVAAHAPQLALGLVAVLLRDYQHPLSLVPPDSLVYLIYHGGGLARARLAGYESEHIRPPVLSILIIMDYIRVCSLRQVL